VTDYTLYAVLYCILLVIHSFAKTASALLSSVTGELSSWETVKSLLKV